MKSVKIQCPAKINLSLKVLNKREDGFHNIESVMQTINLFDYLSICLENSERLEFVLDGNNKDIPYNEKNLVYKAGKLFCDVNNISDKKISVYIDKNIPVSAGLAGGSTDATGMLYGLNILFGRINSEQEVLDMCAKLGSDLNFCYTGGRQMTQGRGEITTPLDVKGFEVNLIKPLGLGISAKEAYTKFSYKKENGLGLDSRDNFVNDLEWALIDDYKELQFIKKNYPKSVMTGSGSTYFSLDEKFKNHNGYWVRNGLKSISYGVKEV